MTAMSWVISAAFLVLVGSSPVQSATDGNVDPAKAQISGCTTPSAKLRGSSSPPRDQNERLAQLQPARWSMIEPCRRSIPNYLA